MSPSRSRRLSALTLFAGFLPFLQFRDNLPDDSLTFRCDAERFRKFLLCHTRPFQYNWMPHIFILGIQERAVTPSFVLSKQELLR